MTLPVGKRVAPELTGAVRVNLSVFAVGVDRFSLFLFPPKTKNLPVFGDHVVWDQYHVLEGVTAVQTLPFLLTAALDDL